MIPTNLRVGFPESSLQSRKNHKAKRSASYFMPVASISQTCRGLAVALCVGHGSIVSLRSGGRRVFCGDWSGRGFACAGAFSARANPGHVRWPGVLQMLEHRALEAEIRATACTDGAGIGAALVVRPVADARTIAHQCLLQFHCGLNCDRAAITLILARYCTLFF